jgi:hypothetical protein
MATVYGFTISWDGSIILDYQFTERTGDEINRVIAHRHYKAYPVKGLRYNGKRVTRMLAKEWKQLPPHQSSYFLIVRTT